MMRKIVYILSFIVVVSCNQFSPKSENATAPKKEEKAVEQDNMIFDADGKSIDFTIDKDNFANDSKQKGFSFTTNTFNLETINTEITAKLQANYEAQILANKHPEFAETIKEQLAASSKFTEAIADSIQTITIEDIEFLGELSTRNEDISVQKMKYTKRINSNYSQKDSVLVVIQRSVIEIDNSFNVNTTFTFEQID